MIKCFFHEDSEPSLAIYPETNTYHCFGCGAHGDAINFIMEYKGMTFKECLQYLNISRYKPAKENSSEMTRRQMRPLIEGFRQWEQRYHANLCVQFRTIQNHKALVKCIDDINETAYHAEPIIEYRLDNLDGNHDHMKFELFQEVNDGHI